ncbi:dihydrodipicolinate synthase family protein [Synechococcus sp. NOUM97013]|uniref:dihydrodipicolinate synthase family protein n=1 Tax=Synechococcus sp. NOUM97013 TaxID=1442555 RepID=UPI00164764B5|nr:dihydrodipicolinate synthase family protein [Synechococcus sp. NOUM97013]QNI72329.1 dihydrodipicolinate synthetase family protein [Synechococcus sp. NOUM97013]
MTNCIPVLLTPFKEDYSIDFEGLENLLGYYKDNSISRLWVLGTGSEDMALEFSIRKTIVDFVVNYSNQHFDCLVGTSFYGLSESLAFTEALNQYNLSGVHYMSYSNLLSTQQALRNFKAICNYSNNPVMGYTSANWGLSFTSNEVDSFSRINNCIGIKYSTSNVVDTENALSYQSSRFEVIPAVVKQLLPSLILGAKSFTTVEASIFLSLITDLEKAFNNSDFQRARKIQRELNSDISSTSKSPSKNNFLRNAEIKSILEHRGICKRWVAQGFTQIDDLEFEELKDFS